TVTFTSIDLCGTETATAIFTVTPPTDVVITPPVDETIDACDFATQAEVDAAFATWLATVSVTGGCDPQIDNGNPTAPSLCDGGSVTVTFTSTDLCGTETATAIFTVTPPTDVVITPPVDETVDACDFATQAEVDAAFATWLATVSVTGGCDPQIDNGNPTAPSLCDGGSVTVTFTSTDLCGTETATAIFTVTPPTDVVITPPVDETVDACDFATQAEVDAAFATWLATVSVTGGCDPQIDNGNP